MTCPPVAQWHKNIIGAAGGQGTAPAIGHQFKSQDCH